MQLDPNRIDKQDGCRNCFNMAKLQILSDTKAAHAWAPILQNSMQELKAFAQTVREEVLTLRKSNSCQRC